MLVRYRARPCADGAVEPTGRGWDHHSLQLPRGRVWLEPMPESGLWQLHTVVRGRQYNNNNNNNRSSNNLKQKLFVITTVSSEFHFSHLRCFLCIHSAISFKTSWLIPKNGSGLTFGHNCITWPLVVFSFLCGVLGKELHPLPSFKLPSLR